jgi:hypothetical protein
LSRNRREIATNREIIAHVMETIEAGSDVPNRSWRLKRLDRPVHRSRGLRSKAFLVCANVSDENEFAGKDGRHLEDRADSRRVVFLLQPEWRHQGLSCFLFIYVCKSHKTTYPGVDVMIANLCEFCQFSANKMAFFSKTCFKI